MNGLLLSDSLVPVAQPQGKTEPKPPLERKASVNALKILDDQPVQAAVLELRGQLTLLTPDSQDFFMVAVLKQIKMIAGLQAVFAFGNQRYHMESGKLIDSQIRENYCLLGERQKAELIEVRSGYEAFKTVFDERIRTLQATINNHVIEMTILREIMTGHASAWDLGSFKRAISCFGAPYRLGEIQAALKERHSKLGTKVGEASPDVELPKPPAADSLVGKLINLTKDIASLKEEAAVIYEALRTGAYEQACKSAWPQNFYTHFMTSLKEHKGTIETLKSDVESRLGEIEQELMAQSAPVDPAVILSRKQERAEITKRWESILAHDKETTNILVLFKKLFHLEDRDEEVDFNDFSSAYTEAFNLLALIIFHREQVMLGSTWESFADIGIRKAVYLKDREQYESLEAQKKQLETEKVAARVQQLTGAIQTYQGYIQTIEHGMQNMQEHLRILDREVQVRGKWPKETPPVTSDPVLPGVQVGQTEQAEQQDE